MPDRLRGKTAIVFGAGSSGDGWGNGKAAAVAYAREGAQVACIDVAQAAADETASIIEREGGFAAAIAADVTDVRAQSLISRASASSSTIVSSEWSTRARQQDAWKGNSRGSGGRAEES